MESVGTAVATDDEQRWSAVIANAPDASFAYSVASTGVYCRAWCRSRTPLRESIAFHRTPGAAEAAGFRACKRCNPRLDMPASR